MRPSRYGHSKSPDCWSQIWGTVRRFAGRTTSASLKWDRTLLTDTESASALNDLTCFI